MKFFHILVKWMFTYRVMSRTYNMFTYRVMARTYIRVSMKFIEESMFNKLACNCTSISEFLG